MKNGPALTTNIGLNLVGKRPFKNPYYIIDFTIYCTVYEYSHFFINILSLTLVFKHELAGKDFPFQQ